MTTAVWRSCVWTEALARRQIWSASPNSLSRLARSTSRIRILRATRARSRSWPSRRSWRTSGTCWTIGRSPRDLFDLWYGVCVRVVPLDRVADAFRAKYSGKPGLWRVQQARRLQAAWEERLAHQVNELPPFQDAFGEVYARVQAWEEGG